MRHRSIREISQGASAVIHEVMSQDNRRLAAKVPLSASSRTQLLDSAKPWAKLTERAPRCTFVSLLSVEDAWNEDPSHGYYVMNLVNGCTVEQFILDQFASWSGSGRWSSALTELATACVRTVSVLHDEGFLHRDIKPQHFLMDPSSTYVWLCDFDLLVEGTDFQSPEIGGTLGYLAPECLDHHYDQRTDVFALGVTLYRLATGRLPWFRRSYLDVRQRQQWDFTKSIGSRMVTLPGIYADTLQIALSPEPNERFASAHEMLRFLST